MAYSKAITVSLLVVKVLRILMILAAGLLTLFVIIQFFRPVNFLVAFPVSFDVYEINEGMELNSSYSKINVGPFELKGGNLRESKTIIENATGRIKIENPSNTFLLTFLILFLLFLFPVYYLLIQLKKFLHSVEEGNPFILENVKRLRIFAFLAIALTIFAGFAQFAGGFYVVSNYNLPGNLSLIHRLNINWGLIFSGIILFVIAEAFKIGISVKKENDLTV